MNLKALRLYSLNVYMLFIFITNLVFVMFVSLKYCKVYTPPTDTDNELRITIVTLYKQSNTAYC